MSDVLLYEEKVVICPLALALHWEKMKKKWHSLVEQLAKLEG